MPKSTPLARLQHINNIFHARTSARAVVKAEALAEELGISLRQLRTDMDVLKEKGAPLEYDAVLKGWRYRPGEYFTMVDNIPLTGEDLACLRIAVETLAKVNHLQGFEQLPAVFGKIHRAAKKWLGHEQGAVGKSVYFDPLPRYDGGRHLPFFLEAIDQSRRVEFDYLAFHASTPKKHVFDPWFLRHYDRRWYVGGFSHDPSEQFVRVFPLERIEGAPRIIGYFHDKPPDYDASTYWRHIYGITVPSDRRVERIVIAFTPLQGKYFLSSPFVEPFEVLESGSEQTIIAFDLMINVELVQKLASLGAGIKVLAPDRLVEELRAYLRNALTQYFGADNN